MQYDLMPLMIFIILLMLICIHRAVEISSVLNDAHMIEIVKTQDAK